MSTLQRTWAGLLLGLLLVGLFYGRLAKDSEEIVRAQAAASKQREQDKIKRDSAEAREARWRRQLVAALGQRGQAAPTPTPKASLIQGPPAAARRRAASASPGVASPTAAAGRRPATTKPTKKLARWDDPLRRQLPWLLPVLAAVGCLAMGWAAWAAWQARNQELLPPQRADKDRPLLRLLLQAYAGLIGRILPNPRQVKRFASKARLQNNLLFALQASTQGKAQPFQFGEAQEILAFLLLLLLEQETDRENKAERASAPGRQPFARANGHATSKAELATALEPATRLRDLDEDDFVRRLQVLFAAWEGTDAGQATYQAFEKAARAAGRTAVPTYHALAATLASPASQRLCVQLHRLNTGLLV